jgi:hypothetical protein
MTHKDSADSVEIMGHELDTDGLEICIEQSSPSAHLVSHRQKVNVINLLNR